MYVWGSFESINEELSGWAGRIRRGLIAGTKKDGLRLCFKALAQRCTVSSARVRRGMGGDAGETQFTGEQLCMPTPHTLAWLLAAASTQLDFSSLLQPADTAAGPTALGSEAADSHHLDRVASFLYVAAERPQLQSLLPPPYRLSWRAAVASLAESFDSHLASSLATLRSDIPAPAASGALRLAPSSDTGGIPTTTTRSPLPLLLSARLRLGSAFRETSLTGGRNTPALLVLLLPRSMVPPRDIGAARLSPPGLAVLLAAAGSLHKHEAAPEVRGF